MKKLRKLFNLLPAFALAVISGLGVVLDYDHTPKQVNADYEQYPLHNEEFSSYVYVTYTDSSQLFPVTNTTNFTIDGTFSYYYVYTESGQSYNFSYSLRLRNCMSTYYQGFTITTTDGPMSESLHVPNSTTTDFRVDLVSFEGISRRNDKIEVRFDFDIYLNGTKLFESTFVRTAVLLSPLATTGYTFFQGTPNQTIMNIHYEVSDYDLAFADGYNAGYNSGFSNGYSDGGREGYNNGYDVGYSAGQASRDNDVTQAYNDGYNAGYDEGFSVDSTAATIFSGILQVGMLPINVLLAIFNFEILGINLSAFISAILTVCLTVIVIRTVTGGKNSE